MKRCLVVTQDTEYTSVLRNLLHEKGFAAEIVANIESASHKLADGSDFKFVAVESDLPGSNDWVGRLAIDPTFHGILIAISSERRYTNAMKSIGYEYASDLQELSSWGPQVVQQHNQTVC